MNEKPEIREFVLNEHREGGFVLSRSLPLGCYLCAAGERGGAPAVWISVPGGSAGTPGAHHTAWLIYAVPSGEYTEGWFYLATVDLPRVGGPEAHHLFGVRDLPRSALEARP